MGDGSGATGGGPNMQRVDTCLVFISEALASPPDSPVLTFILVLTFIMVASESDHYISNLRRRHADKLLAKNEILHNTAAFPLRR